VRLFLALNLPPAVRDAAHAAAEPLRRAAPGVAWTAAEKLHLTVKFLGEQPEGAAATLAAALAPVVTRHPPAELDIVGVGAFPRLTRPRVLWLGVRPDPKLELLHHDVEAACAALGHPLSGRAFRPHVTLGRVRPRAEPVDARALATAVRQVHLRSGASVSTLDLMLSEPARGGTRYVALARLPMGPSTLES
jgi:2'-5' RNA ligase